MDGSVFQQVGERRKQHLIRRTEEILVQEKLAEINPAAALSAELALKEEREAAEAEIKDRIRSTDYEILFERFPLLREAYAEVSAQMEAMQSEFEERISRDRDVVSRKLLHGRPLGRILALTGDGADVHNHGRMTLRVESEGGTFYYKAHSCAVDTVMRNICETLFSGHVLVPYSLNMGTYAYCEYIENRPAVGPEATKAFFYNTGILCAIAACIGMQDLHSENILAQDTVPVLVDPETALPVPAVSSSSSVMENPFTEVLQNSLFTSAILPLQTGDGKFSILVSTHPRNPSAPRIGEEKQSGLNYQPDIMAGFSYGYVVCMEQREKVKALLEPLKEAPIRVLLRNTDDYMHLMNALNTAEALREPQTQQRILDRLSLGMTPDRLALFENIIGAERSALLERNIPYFYTYGADRAVYSNGTVLAENFFRKSALDLALARLDALSDREKQFEEDIIRSSFRFVMVPVTREDRKKCEETERAETETADKEDMKRIAREILMRLYDESFLSPAGDRGFFVLRSDIGQAGGLRCDLGTGTAGIGVFAAAYKYLYPQDREAMHAADTLICLALDNLRRFTESCEALRSVPGELTVGLSTGYAGMLRAAEFLAWYTRDPMALELPERLLSLTERIRFQEIGSADVYSGLAGLLLVLTAPDLSGRVPRKLLTAVSERLIQLQTLSYKGSRLWPTVPGLPRPLSGYGHGMAGIGMALVRAFRQTGEERSLQAASEAYAFEHAAYSERLGTWPDLRSNPLPERYMHGICSGAPGLVIALREAADSPIGHVTEDLARAKDAIVRLPLQYRDNLCCGRSAVAEALIMLQEHEIAAEVAGRIIESFRKEGHFRLGREGFSPVPLPDLMQGTAGIGYTMLRLTAPDRIRSIFE